jgi:hypothetical protein
MFRLINRATKKQNVTDAARFDKVLSQVVEKRLTYAEVIGKTEEAAF